MQTRLQNLIDNRMRMLAAISHDLRTPLTLLRLRAENIEDVQERDRLLARSATWMPWSARPCSSP
jgi:signal transduction histidine kinase